MNEQIKQLALQAGIEYVDPMKGWIAVDEDLKLFAEIVAQVCIDKIETYQIPVGNSASGELACEWTYDALKEIRDEIKEHFGIDK